MGGPRRLTRTSASTSMTLSILILGLMEPGRPPRTSSSQPLATAIGQPQALRPISITSPCPITSATTILCGDRCISLLSTVTPTAGSVARYNADFGAQLVTATAESITLDFYNRTGALVDTLTLHTSLSAISMSKSQIDLRWSDFATDEDGYSIEQSVDGNTFGQIDTVGPNVTSYSNTRLSASTTYYYR